MAGDNCCICLESLFSEDAVLGVCNPCGHPMHQKCFDDWAGNIKKKLGRSFRREEDVKCPTCNTPGVSFTKIFINFPTAIDALSDDDDNDSDDGSSVGSLVEPVFLDDDDDDDDDDNSENDDDKEEERNSSSRDSVDQPQEVARPIHHQEEDEVVDLTDDTEPTPKQRSKGKEKKRSPTTTPSAAAAVGSTDDEKNYKRKAKRNKKLCKQMKSKYDELSKAQHELHIKVKTATTEAKTAKAKAKELENDHETHMHSLRHARLDVIRLKRELEEQEYARDCSETKLKDVTEDFANTKATFQRKIDHAKQSHQVEMDKILKEYPIVCEQKRGLEAELVKKERYVDDLKKRLKTLEPRLRKQIEVGLHTEAPPQDQRQLKKNLMLMNAMSNDRHTTDVHNKRQRDQIDMTSKARKKSTQRAVLMVESIKPRKFPAPGSRTSNIDALLGGSKKQTTKTSQQQQHHPSTKQGARRVSTEYSDTAAATVYAPSLNLGNAKKCAKPTTAVAVGLNLNSKANRTKQATNRQGGFSKKAGNSSVQGDLRSMFGAKR